jgi:hypothetical protein
VVAGTPATKLNQFVGFYFQTQGGEVDFNVTVCISIVAKLEHIWFALRCT